MRESGCVAMIPLFVKSERMNRICELINPFGESFRIGKLLAMAMW